MMLMACFGTFTASRGTLLAVVVLVLGTLISAKAAYLFT
jgi:hypothetical protein